MEDVKPENQIRLAYYWQTWRDATGRKMRSLYQKYVELGNKGAVLNGNFNTSGFLQASSFIYICSMSSLRVKCEVELKVSANALQSTVYLGYADLGDYWNWRFESDTFKEDIDAIFHAVNEQLYRHLFAYVRFKLVANGFSIAPNGPIGAHLLGMVD